MKRIICIFVIVLQVVLLSCCSKDEDKKLEETTREFIENTKNYEFDKMKQQVKDTNSVENVEKSVKSFFESELKDRTIVDASISDEEQKQHIDDIYKDMSKVIEKMDVSSIDKLYFEFLSDCAKKTSYNINEVDSSNMMVNVTFSYVDTKKLIDDIMTKCITVVYEKGDSDYDKSASKIRDFFENKIKEYDEKVKNDSGNLEYIKEDLYINFDKDDMLVKEIDKDLQNVIEIGTKKNIDSIFEENEKQIITWFEQTKKEVENEMKDY